MVNETINPSKWTHYEVISPPGLAGLAVSNVIIYTVIFITISLILATFSKMKKKSLHQHLIICLAIIDLLTIPAQVPTMVALWKRHIWLTDDLCKLLSIANNATIAATAWLHIAICIEKCCSILMPLQHKLFLTRYKSSVVATTIALIELGVILTFTTVLAFIHNLDSGFKPALALCAFTANLNYFIAIAMPFVFSPLLIVLVTHTIMLIEVKKLARRNRQRRNKGIKVVALTVGVYYACWVPFFVNCFWMSVVPPSILELPITLRVVAVYFVISNSAMNFFIYVYSIQDFKEQLIRLYCAKYSVSAIRNIQTISSR